MSLFVHKKRKSAAAKGARIKPSTAMFLSSDLKGLPSAHYSPCWVTWVPISMCNNDFSDMDSSLLETGSTKLISSSSSKSHQKVTTLHRDRLSLYKQCRNRRLSHITKPRAIQLPIHCISSSVPLVINFNYLQMLWRGKEGRRMVEI